MACVDVWRRANDRAAAGSLAPGALPTPRPLWHAPNVTILSLLSSPLIIILFYKYIFLTLIEPFPLKFWTHKICILFWLDLCMSKFDLKFQNILPIKS